MSEQLPVETNEQKIEVDAQKKEINAQKKETPLANAPEESASDDS